MNKKTVLLLLFALVAILLAAILLYNRLSLDFTQAEPVQAADEAVPAADFAVEDKDGATVHLSDFLGKPVIVNFWTTWCGYCVQELPNFQECADEFGEEISFMMIDMTDGIEETKENGLAMAEENGYTFPLYFDTMQDAANTYRIHSYPITLLIDAEGNLVDTHVGMMQEEALREYIAMLQNKEETK